jgi:hypothetical protein
LVNWFAAGKLDVVASRARGDLLKLTGLWYLCAMQSAEHPTADRLSTGAAPYIEATDENFRTSKLTPCCASDVREAAQSPRISTFDAICTVRGRGGRSVQGPEHRVISYHIARVMIDGKVVW